VKTRRKTYADDAVALPPTKRCKAEAEEDAAGGAEPEPAPVNIGCLPPEMWALALEFLLYEEVLRSCTVSKNFLHDVMPRITRICIMHSRELHVAPTGRFKNVTLVNMFCLLQCSPGNCSLHTIDADAAGRIVPFLSRFPKLEESNLLGLCEHDVEDSGWYQYEPETCASPEEGRPVMTSLIHSLCGGFRSGLLSQGVKAVNGPTCPRREPNADGTGCEHCKMMVHAFPLDTVVYWQHHGSEEGLSEPYADFYNSLCLTSSERLECIAERPGGKEMLKKKAKDIFEHLLSCVAKGPAENQDGTTTDVYFYNEAVLSDFVALADYLFKNRPSQLNRLLNVDDCLDSIWEGVEMHEERKEGYRPHFSAVSLDELADIGIPIAMSAFRILDYKEDVGKWVHRGETEESA